MNDNENLNIEVKNLQETWEIKIIGNFSGTKVYKIFPDSHIVNNYFLLLPVAIVSYLINKHLSPL